MFRYLIAFFSIGYIILVPFTKSALLFSIISKKSTNLSGSTLMSESKIEITSNTQLTSGYNGLSVGPVAVGNGIVVTVPANSTWKVI